MTIQPVQSGQMRDTEGVTVARRRSTGPSDMEKGQLSMSHFSEDEKELGNSIIMQPISSSELEIKEQEGRKNDDSAGYKVVTRKKHWRPNKAWFILVFLGLGTCWIPAILEWTKFPKARVWGVRLLFWSIWLSILWAGWWFALVVSWIWHRVLLLFIHLFNFWRLKRYVNWLEYLHGYLALSVWTAALWITWVPLIADQQMGNDGQSDSNTRSIRAVNLGGRLFFALAGCAAILLAEKTAVQWLAMKFHERSYQRRIRAQKEAVQAFKLLFSLVKGMTTVSDKRGTSVKKYSRLPRQWSADTYLTLSNQEEYNYDRHIIDRAPTSKLQTAFTDVTGQIFGVSQLDDDDVVGRAFHREGSKRMKMLAQDIWDGLVGKSTDAQIMVDESGKLQETPALTKSVIEARRYKALEKPDQDKEQYNISTDKIWSVLTSGSHQDRVVRKQDFMRKCSDLHAEQRRLEETMNDLQNVVGRLDDLMMVFWVAACILIFAVALDAELKNLIFGAGSVFVGTSWLIRDTATEVFASIVFLFSKHPFDVEDQVIIKDKRYKVVEMRLLSTVFHDDDSVQVQAPNSLLNTLFIHNLRRSPATSEPFTVEVSDTTTKTQLDNFARVMTDFLLENPKDYRGEFEIEIREVSLLSRKMVLYMDIKYNNNWESSAEIRANRRNKWIYAMREALQLSGIEGPGTPFLHITTTHVPGEGMQAA